MGRSVGVGLTGGWRDARCSLSGWLGAGGWLDVPASRASALALCSSPTLSPPSHRRSPPPLALYSGSGGVGVSAVILPTVTCSVTLVLVILRFILRLSVL